MAKAKTQFFCQNCGAQSPKWVGKCPNCKQWNTYVEEVIQQETKNNTLIPRKLKKESKTIPLAQIETDKQMRIDMLDSELNRVLGGGLVPGSITLIGGEPGIGKSTLLLQIATNLKDTKILYVSGEESAIQIKLRADRLNKNSDNCLLLTETNTQLIFKHIENVLPEIIIIDSIQTLYTDRIDSSPGSVSQIRETTSELLKYAKTYAIPIFLIGHITKDGSIAGPKILEHMVDTVLQFEGDRNYEYRIIRSIKNRFGSTSELGIYEMRTDGLRTVNNPSEILLSERHEELSGIAIAVTMEGLRPLLIETQALISNSAYGGNPQRSSTGFDNKRMNMLLAVLEKRLNFKFGTKDAFLNITGGIKSLDPATDLAVVCSILSSYIDIAIKHDICFAGEVGLSGEIRSVNKIDQRIMEADKLGFKKIFISAYHNTENFKNTNIEIHKFSKIEDLFKALFA